MKILISGSTGLVATHLMPRLLADGHEIVKLVRKSPKSADEIQWDAATGFSDSEVAKLEGIDAVVHLAGDNVASGSWTDSKKRSIRESRIVGTRVLVENLARMKNPPKVFVSASAIGFYGNRGDEILSDDSAKGTGFFPDVCEAWETEAKKAEQFARIVCLRIGVILTEDGGALEKMLTPFKLGVGGVVGSGKQYMPWIAIDDIVGIFKFALENEISGSFNTTAPNPVTNHDFTKALGNALNRPTFFPIPEFAIKLMFGEMGETLLLQGCRVIPKRIQELGYKFQFENINNALKHILI
jgi:uncharacterized protein